MDNPGNDQSYQNEIPNEQTYATRRPKTQLPLPTMNCHQTVQINNQMNDDQTDNNQIQQQQQQYTTADQSNEEIKKIHPNLVSAANVAEVLKAAGEAFCRLGECTMMLNSSSIPNKTKWENDDVTQLSETMKKFREDLGSISETMQKRTSQKLKDNLQKHFAGGQKRTGIQRQGSSGRPVGLPLNNTPNQKREAFSPSQSGEMKRQRIAEPIRQVQVQQRTVQYQNQQQQQPQQQQQNQQQQQRQLTTISRPNQQPSQQNQRSPVGQQQSSFSVRQSNVNVTQISRSNSFTPTSGQTQGQRFVQTTAQGPIVQQSSQGQMQHSQNVQGQRTPVQRVVQVQQGGSRLVGQMPTSTQHMMIGADGGNGPKYTVQQTIIDGKKTLILDHQDLARLLQSNNGSGAAVVLQSSDGNNGNNQQQGSQPTLMVMPTQPNGSQNR